MTGRDQGHKLPNAAPPVLRGLAVTFRAAVRSSFVTAATTDFTCGSVTSLDAEQRRIRIKTDTQEREIAFDQATYTLGSNVDVDKARGVTEHAYRLDAGGPS